MDLQELKRSVIENTKFTFSRSGGNGGQNVNKLNTKAHGTLAISEIRGLSEDELTEVLKKLNGKINNDNFICIDVDDERYQESNRRIALDRLEGWIKTAAQIKPKRKKTKPTRASKEKRLESKKLHGKLKKERNWKKDIGLIY